MSQTCIYAIICNKTWRTYLGSTVHFLRRKEGHLGQLRTNKHTCSELQDDFNKFGEESFYFEIIEEILDDKLLLKREEFWRKQSENLYNKNQKIYLEIPELDEVTKDRFWSKVIKTDNCWNWYKKESRFKHQQRMYIASRISYKLANPDFDESLLVCHTCDNPICVNPAHLFLGSSSVNATDRINKGRGCKLNPEIAKQIREKYLSGMKKSTQLKPWIEQTFNKVVTTQAINDILANRTFIDENWEITGRTQDKQYHADKSPTAKLNWKIVNYIRDLYSNKIPIIAIQIKLMKGFGVTLNKAYISTIALNKSWVDNSYIPKRRNFFNKAK